LPGSPRARLLPLSVLAIVIAITFGVWWASSKSGHGELPASPPDDDLPSIPRTPDARIARPPARDVLVAGTDRLYLSRAGDHSIAAIPKTGGAGATLAHVDGPVYGMAFADASLWLTTIAPGQPAARSGAVLKLGLAGAPPVVVTDGLVSPRAVAADGKWVFVVDVDAGGSGLLAESAILRFSAREQSSGARLSPVARSKGEVSNITLDERFVYWADRFEGTIVAAPKEGGDPRVLASGRQLPGDVIADGGTLYWVEERSNSLWTLPKGGGAPRQIAQDFAGFAGLTSGAGSLWWTNAVAVEGAYQVLTMPKTGGEPSVAAAAGSASTMGGLASDGSRVYWERDGNVVPVAN
jgi:hypothetical protein